MDAYRFSKINDRAHLQLRDRTRVTLKRVAGEGAGDGSGNVRLVLENSFGDVTEPDGTPIYMDLEGVENEAIPSAEVHRVAQALHDATSA